MTAEELIRNQVDDAGFQIRQTLQGFPETGLDVQPLAHMMSVRQQIAHLCEAYVAVKTTAQGGKHQWGSFAAEAESWEELRTLFDTLRNEAIDVALANAGGVDLLNHYIVAHDYYHVGQLVAIRMALEPEWDSYAIYQ